MKRGFQIWICVLLFIVLGMTNSVWGQVREWEMQLKTIQVDPESDYAIYARRDLKKMEEANHGK